jgi:hypothetical protein
MVSAVPESGRMVTVSANRDRWRFGWIASNGRPNPKARGIGAKRSANASAVIVVQNGASVIQCCYAAIERRQSPTSTNMAGSKNTNITFRSAQECIVEEKISLNVSRFLVNPACMAEVLTSRPNFSAR